MQTPTPEAGYEQDDSGGRRHGGFRGLRRRRAMALCLSLMLARSGASFHCRRSARTSEKGLWHARSSFELTHTVRTVRKAMQCSQSNDNVSNDNERRSRVTATARSGTTTKKQSTKDTERQIVALGRKGRTDQALSIYRTAERPTVRMMNGAIDACARARPCRLDEAFEMLDFGVERKRLKPNVFTFGSLMSVCSRAGNADRALRLLQVMKLKYNVEPNAVVYSTAISACARANPPRPDRALNLLREAVEEKELAMSVVGFNAAVSACAQAGDWKNAISILTRMEEASSKQETDLQQKIPSPDVVTYGTVLAACERAERWKQILTYAERMKEVGMELDGLAISSCLHACQRLGLAQRAKEYLEQMKTVRTAERRTAGLIRSGARQPLLGPDPVAYRLAISACARGGEWQDGIRLLQELESTTGAAGDVVAYTAAITGCEYAGRWRQAFLLLDAMRKKGVEPNEWTMAAVIGACATACAKENKPDQMLVPQQKAFRLLNVLKTDPSVVKPNIQVYNAAIRVCAEACDLEGAMQLLDEIKYVGLERTAVTYGSLMTACERVGDVDSVSKVFRLLFDDGIEPNEIIYGAAISCCRKAKQPERAMALLKKMIKTGLDPNIATFNTVLTAQTEGRKMVDLERAIMVYKLMKSKYAGPDARPNRQSYNLLVKALAASKQPAMAETFLRKMQEDGYKPDVDLYTVTVSGYERIGQPMKALQLMEGMQQDGYDFYSIKVLNSAFKNAVKLANAVGRGLAASTGDDGSRKGDDVGESEQGRDWPRSSNVRLDLDEEDDAEGTIVEDGKSVIR